MYTENYVAISNSTNPLAVAVSTDLTMANVPTYNSVFDLYVQQIKLKGSGETFTGARISRNSKKYLPIEQNPGEIFGLNLYLDSVVQKSSFSRHDWIKVIGTVGGVERFYGMFIMMVIGYFTEIDYMAEFIKSLFLEK